MLELTRPYGAPVRGFVSAYITHGVAREPWQLAAYWQLRRQVFCNELAIFAGAADERDEHDAHAIPIVALAHSAGSPESVVGVVRIYAANSGVWFGGRLGVDAAYRVQRQVGVGLIRAAVETADALGCERFFAHVLATNVPYFMRQRFRPLCEVELHGQRHVLMEAQLPRRSTLQQAFV